MQTERILRVKDVTTRVEQAFQLRDCGIGMNRTSEDYLRFRGRCKELVDAACAEDGTLLPLRGFYFCPIWNRDSKQDIQCVQSRPNGR